MSSLEDFHIKVVEELATLRQISSDILAQTTKTNGRVTSAESRLSALETAIALVNDSRKNNSWWKEKISTSVIGVLVSTFAFVIMLMLQKLGIIVI